MRNHITRGVTALTLGILLATASTSCIKDLDRDPPANQLSADQIFRDPANYRGLLAKMYAGLTLTGQNGPTGAGDIAGSDEGATSYYRLLWEMQELPTDEAVIAWTSDGSLVDLNTATWTNINAFIQFMMVRIYYQVGLTNEYLRQTTDSKLSERGITGADAETARQYRADARFLRALSYYHAADLFGKGVSVKETDPVGYFLPKQTSRAELFAFVESELKEIEGQLPDRPEYGRAGKAAAQALLAQLYLNAEVYIQQPRYSECIEYCKRVIASPAGYQLAANYRNLFRADNNITSASEIIFPLVQDGLNSQNYGGTTFLINAALDNSPLSRGPYLRPADQGMSGGWGGIRAKKNLPLLFTADTARFNRDDLPDRRAMFSAKGNALVPSQQVTLDILTTADLGLFRKGLSVRKWSNLNADNSLTGSLTFASTDIPLLRLGDVYLMYAEAVVRGGTGGDRSAAVGYINALRERAYGDASGNISDGDMTLDFLLAERGRELYWEGHRRQDLVRFGKFVGGDYLWPFKGSDLTANAGGIAVDSRYNLYPIPTADLISNPNLTQNPGY